MAAIDWTGKNNNTGKQAMEKLKNVAEKKGMKHNINSFCKLDNLSRF